MNIVEMLDKYENNNDCKMIAMPDHDLKDVLNFVHGDEKPNPRRLRGPDGKMFEVKF